MKPLTKAEEQVMQHLWDLKKAFLKDLAEAFEEPKPAYTTISTLIGILIRKKIVGFIKYGNNREYYPLIDRETYLKQQFDGVLSSYFENSFSKFASFYTQSEDLSMKELEEIRKILDQQIMNRKTE